MFRIWSILLLAVIWCGFSNNFSASNIVLAVIVSAIINLVVMRKVKSSNIRIVAFLWLMIFVVYELVISSLQVARIILFPEGHCFTSIVEIDLDCQNEIQMTLVANILSLTPGSLTIGINNEDKSIVIHVLQGSESASIIDYVKERLEPKVLRAFPHADK